MGKLSIKDYCIEVATELERLRSDNYNVDLLEEANLKAPDYYHEGHSVEEAAQGIYEMSLCENSRNSSSENMDFNYPGKNIYEQQELENCKNEKVKECLVILMNCANQLEVIHKGKNINLAITHLFFSRLQSRIATINPLVLIKKIIDVLNF